jgi:hypothetical protein
MTTTPPAAAAAPGPDSKRASLITNATLSFADGDGLIGGASRIHRAFFNQALRLYAASVSFSYADFPINLSSGQLKGLEVVFEAPARTLFGRRDSFDSLASWSTSSSATAASSSAGSGGGGWGSEGDWGYDEKRALKGGGVAQGERKRKSVVLQEDAEDGSWWWGPIPSGFSIEVFDEAERSVKQMVLMDTWPKFVRSGGVEGDEEAGSRRAGRGCAMGPLAMVLGRRWRVYGNDDHGGNGVV